MTCKKKSNIKVKASDKIHSDIELDQLQRSVNREFYEKFISSPNHFCLLSYRLDINALLH